MARRVIEALNGRLRDGLRNCEWFRSRAEARMLIECCRQFYNEQRLHSTHCYQPPATARRAWPERDNIDARFAA